MPIPTRTNQIQKIIKFDNLEETGLAYLSHPHIDIWFSTPIYGQILLYQQKKFAKIKERIESLHLKYIKPTSQNKCANMMLSNSMHSYSPPQTNFACKDLHNCDQLLISHIQKAHGITSTDAYHIFFINEHQEGLNFKSFLQTDLLSIVRELEVVLNGN